MELLALLTCSRGVSVGVCCRRSIRRRDDDAGAVEGAGAARSNVEVQQMHFSLLETCRPPCASAVRSSLTDIWFAFIRTSAASAAAADIVMPLIGI